jgi:hypothetical protein
MQEANMDTVNVTVPQASVRRQINVDLLAFIKS